GRLCYGIKGLFSPDTFYFKWTNLKITLLYRSINGQPQQKDDTPTGKSIIYCPPAILIQLVMLCVTKICDLIDGSSYLTFRQEVYSHMEEYARCKAKDKSINKGVSRYRHEAERQCCQSGSQ